MTLAIRLMGAALALACLLPLHRVLDPKRAGPAGAATRDVAEASWLLGVTGTLIIVIVAWVATRMRSGDSPQPTRLARLCDAVARPAPRRFAAFTGIAAGLGSGILASQAHGRAPTSVDEMSQLLHAAVVASGRLALPTGDTAEALILQNGILTSQGWASIYPPLHTLFLAAGLLTGAAWLVGPILTGLATGVSTWTLERLIGTHAARLSGLLLCVSPFWLLIGASHLSHTSAAAGLAIVSLGCLLARDAGARRAAFGWAVLAGAGMGIAVSSRPWVGLVCSVALVFGLWGWGEYQGDRRRVWTLRLLGMLTGGSPFAVLLFGWNTVLFGHPFRLGYAAAFGPTHGLGWHVDPWGNRYGLIEAVGYTGADIAQLGVRLLESPMPGTLLIALMLLLGPTAITRRAAVPTLWAGSALAANALYWHHGIHFGPRMLFESAPAWMGLIGLATTSVFRSKDGAGTRVLRWTTGLAVSSGIVLSLSTLWSSLEPATHRPPDQAHPVTTGPPGSAAPKLVFVHGSWGSRVAARLAAAGMRRDSIETALRRNDLCQVDRFARWRSSPTGQPPPLDFEARPGSPPELQTRVLSPGNSIRVSADVEPDATCRREARADRFGALELETVAWQAPAVGNSGLLYVRDLGPGANLRFPGAVSGNALVWIDHVDTGSVILPYDEGMQLLWGGPSD